MLYNLLILHSKRPGSHRHRHDQVAVPQQGRTRANNNEKMNVSEIIKENFFIIDSNNLDEISSHMYGFSISKKGILTDNYYKELGLYEDPEPQGIYIMIRKIGNKITINQDFYEVKEYKISKMVVVFFVSSHCPIREVSAEKM